MSLLHHHVYKKETTVVPVTVCYFNNTLANGPLRQFISYPQSGTPTVRIGNFDGYEWGFYPNGTQYGNVRYNGAIVADQVGTFNMLMSKYTVGVNTNIDTNPIFYTICETNQLEDPAVNTVCTYNATNHKVFTYLNGTRTWSAVIDGVTYGWRSNASLEGAASYLTDFTVNGVGSANTVLRDYVLNRCSVGATISGTDPIRSGVCVKYYT